MLWPPVNCLFSFCHISEFGFPLSIEVDFQYTVIHQFYCSFMSAKVKDKIKDPGIGSVTSLLYNLDIFRIFLSHYPQLPPFSESPDLLICGHTHIPSLFTWENTLSCNPGSIGAPYDRDPRSSYGILTLSAQPGFEIRRISYDTLEELRLAQQKAIPFFSLYEPSIQYGIRSNTPPQATFIKPEAP